MSFFAKTRTKLFTGAAALIAAAVALGASPWVAPVEAAPEEEAAFFVHLNWPAGEIEDGQNCTAYFNITGTYTPPLDITWTGQFTNADASTGAYGANSIVSGVTSSSRDASLEVSITDANDESAVDFVSWTWGDENESCGI